MSNSKLRSQRSEDPGSGGGDERLRELRELLLSPYQSRLDQLDRRLSDPKTRSEDVGDVLVEALQLRDGKDQSVTSVLAPRIEAGLRMTVQRNPKILVDILFPIIGPMIRKAIAESFRRLIEAFNEAFEHSFTLRGLRWRWEAWRSGRSFSEVVLLHTLEYRVEQVFLIHGESGLLINHVALETVIAENPDLVSGMFTALRDFVKDSFRVDESGSVGELQVGDLTIWAEAAPHTTLAAVIRGSPPIELRDLLQNASEAIHRRLGAELASYDGEQSLDAETQPYLLDCLLQKRLPTRTPVLAWSLIGILLISCLLIFGYVSLLQLLQSRKFEQYVDALRREPGIVVTEVSRDGGRYRLAGLRDPLAVEPEEIARAVGWAAEDLDSSWKSYFSTDDPLVLRRAQTILGSPENVRISFSRGILRFTGHANPDWIVRARELIPLVPGIVSVDTSELSTFQSEWFLDLQRSVESTRIFFGPGSRTIAPNELGKLAQLADALKELFRSGYPQSDVRVEVLGMADSAGETEFNRRLSQERAETVRLELIAGGVEETRLLAIGQGEGGNQFSARRVTLRIVKDNPTSEGTE